jgi:carboxyl-terminal processing protease
VRRRGLSFIVAMVAVAGCRRAPAQTEPPISSSLAVATFDSAWRIVRNTHFDTTFNGVDWNAVRSELRPKAERAGSTEAVRDVIRSMLYRLHQSHFDVFPIEAIDTRGDSTIAELGDVGLTLRLIDGEMLVEHARGSAASAGVRPGWIVRRVGEYVVADSVKNFARSRYARLPGATPELVAASRFRGPLGESIRAEFLDGAGAVVSRDIVREREPGDPVKFGNLPLLVTDFESSFHPRTEMKPSLGVVRFNFWMVPIVVRLDRAIDSLRAADGMIIDLRENPGGYAATISGVAGHFLEERLSLGTMRARGSETRLLANPRVVTNDGRRVKPYGGPVAILIGPHTGSASEVFASGMQAIHRARVFGEPSFGGVLPATIDKLPNGDALYHAVADFVAPNGDRVEGRGVLPDERVRPTREALLAGRDPVYDAAVQWIAAERARRTRP